MSPIEYLCTGVHGTQAEVFAVSTTGKTIWNSSVPSLGLDVATRGSLNHDAGVDRQGDTGDKASVIGSEENQCLADVEGVCDRDR